MKVALCQVNPTVGDVAGNRDMAGRAIDAARDAGADVAILPEMCLTGYPPMDLLDRSEFVAANLAARDALARSTRGIAAIVGHVDRNPSAVGKPLRNAASVIDDGRVVSVHHKRLLPTYDVFDESRWFEPAAEIKPATIRGHRVGVTICEDAWAFDGSRRLYADDPPAILAAQGIDLLVNIAASPFTLSKRACRPALLADVARRTATPLAFVNMVGGNDDLVFDGSSAIFRADGIVNARAHEFREDMVVADVNTGGDVMDRGTDISALLDALVLGTRDYARKCGFRSAVLGLSGGIDSALVAWIAAHALGAPNVHCVALPSRYSSDASSQDAQAIANALGCPFMVVSIDGTFGKVLGDLGPALDLYRASSTDATAENIQARLRGLALMAISNRHGHLLLTTGNKSEVAVGYCTLYGDMAGGLAVISDVPKTVVYALAREANGRMAAIPERVFTKAPSAELRPGQTDQDSLPPYDVLDRVVHLYVEVGASLDEIAASGVPRDVVDRVVGMIRASEYKRRQMPPGLIVTSKAFGPGRRVPIAKRFRD